ncbi:hypothetical protein P3X46_033772 [Hevea brasiliensis]|uniref:Uncharacterized protein n=1 Tax=Hevea brasiliensis TaxID=3981 RepID=A0ABQ9K9U2_HEVBR|nr:hypothetical protein P3X46_033772 [Hevea brasiliensis]
MLPSHSLSLKYLPSSFPFSPSAFLYPPSQSFYCLFSSALDFDPCCCQIFTCPSKTFTNLISLLSLSLISFLPPSIPLDSTIAATLLCLAHNAFYESVMRRFGLDSPATMHLGFYSICKMVNEKLGDLVDFRRDLACIVMEFEWISLPNCYGKFNSLIHIGGCFALLSWLLTPFIMPNEEDSFDSTEGEFIGNAFGRVKAWWQLWAKRWKDDCTEFFPFAIYSEPLPEKSVGCILCEKELLILEREANERGERTRYVLAKHLLTWFKSQKKERREGFYLCM